MSYFVTLEKFVNELHVEVLSVPSSLNEIKITSLEVNRPGLLLTGHFEYFDPTRIQILGRMEMSYLDNLPTADKIKRLETLFSANVPAVVITRNMLISSQIVEMAKKHNIPLLRTTEATSNFMAAAITFLNNELAKRVTRHGVLVEVYGEGILIMGDSGVGKSEAAIELVKRGHRLIADDAVEIRRISDRVLLGQSPSNIQHFIELRGVGIINIARAYGSGAVKESQEINMIILLENWNPEKSYSTIGLHDEYMDILGNSIVKTTIPVRPGRNLSIIIETAALNNRQKKMGYHPTKELFEKLGIEE